MTMRERIARAKMLLADEYDAAQERGEVKSNGGARNFSVPDQNSELPTAADIGISRKDIHEARTIRHARGRAGGGMRVDREGSDWIVVDDAGTVQGHFGSSSAAWRFADRCSGEPINPAEKKSDWIASKILGAPVREPSRRYAPRNNEAWTWPEGLFPLRDWLASRHVDVGSIKTARQALWMAISLGKLKMRMPGKRDETFPALRDAQRRLCRAQSSTGARSSTVTREHGLGTFGPASEVRRIDPANYRIGGQA